MTNEYIRRQDAVDAFEDTTFTKNEIRRRLLDIKPADVAPVRHGKWTKLFYDGFNCNKCGSTFVIMQGRNNMYYCPNCGAKMDGKREE